MEFYGDFSLKMSEATKVLEGRDSCQLAIFHLFRRVSEVSVDYLLDVWHTLPVVVDSATDINYKSVKKGQLR